MRPVEALLLLATVLSFLALAIPLPRTVRWMHRLAPIALLVAIVQVLVEGPRWQMVPAYALTGLFVLVWQRRSIAPPAEATGRKRAHGLAIALGLLGLAVAVALPVVLPVFRLPVPSGPYGIGTVTYHWEDAGRQEVFSVDPAARRELMVQVWYPAKHDSASPRARYLPDADVVAPALARLLHLPGFAFGHLKGVTTNAIPSAAVSDAEPGYPVLIFVEGLSGFRQMNTFQVEELVSHGYVVAAIDQPYTAAAVVFPDGRRVAGLSKQQVDPLIQQSISPGENAAVLNGRAYRRGIIPYLAQDAIFTLDRLAALNRSDPNGILTGRLDRRRVGIFGISLGGIVVGEACRLDARLHACLVMDAPMPADVVAAGLQQPAMWITRDAGTMQLEGWAQADIIQTQASMRAVFEKRMPADGYFVRVAGMFHVNLTDIPYWSPLFSRLGVAGPIDGQRAHDIVNAYSLAFFDQHLNGGPTVLLDRSASRYPEVQFETRRP